MIIGRATYDPGWKWSEHVGPLIGKDFFKMIIGLSLSVVIVLLIHGFAFDGLKNQ